MHNEVQYSVFFVLHWHLTMEDLLIIDHRQLYSNFGHL